MAQSALDLQALPPILTTRQIAEVLHLHVNTVKKLCRTGRLPAVKVGAVWRIKREDLLALIETGAVPGEAGSQAERAGSRVEAPPGNLPQHRQRLALLHEIDRAILAAHSPSEIARAAAEGVLGATDAARVVITLWQAEDNTLEVLAAAGMVNSLLKPGARLPLLRWPWLATVREGRVAFVDDLTQVPDLIPEAQAALAQGIRSQVVMPLLVGGRTVGHLALSRRSAGRLPDEDLALAQRVADSLAVAMHHARLLEAELQARRQLETLQAANLSLARSLDLDEVLDALLDCLGTLIPYDSANVMLLTGPSMVAVRAMRGYERWTDPALTRQIAFDSQANPAVREIFSRQQSLLIPDTTQYPGWAYPPGGEHVRSWLAIPLVVGSKVLGLFSVDKVEAGFFRPEHVRLAEALAPQAAVAIQNARLYAEVQDHRHQLQSLSRRLVDVQEQERRALSRDLHDTSGQNITALKFGLGSLRRAAGTIDAARASLDELLELADTVAEDLHRLAVNLRPASLDRYGLVPALEQLLTEFRKSTGVQVNFVVPDIVGPAQRLPGQVETALYRIVQESLTNVGRYAQAQQVSVILMTSHDRVQVIVEDDGRGFDVEQALGSGRIGLLGMRERMEMLGGTLHIESGPGFGSTIYAGVPVRLAESEDVAHVGSKNPVAAVRAPGAAGDVVEPDAHLVEAAELARAKALSDALVEITAGTARLEDAKELLAFVLAHSSEAIGCNYAITLLREGDHWVVTDGYRLHRPTIGQHLSDSQAPTAVTVERTGEMVVVNDIPAADPLAAHYKSWAARSGAMIPLEAGGKFLGVVSYVRETAGTPITPSEVAFLNRLAALVSLAMENIHLREIEARQRGELAQRVEELQSVLELLPVGVGIAYDPQCRTVTANPALAEMLGLAVADNVSRSANEGAGPAPYRVFDLAGRELAAGELPMQVAAAQGRAVGNRVTRVLRADGRELMLLGSAVPLFGADGRPRGAVAGFSDITPLHEAQQQLEEANQESEVATEELQTQAEELAGANLQLAAAAERLRRSEATYRAIAQNFPNGAIYVFDHALRYLVVEGELLPLLGQTPAGMEGKSIWEALDAQTVATIEPRYRRTLAGESLHFETRYGEQFGNRIIASAYRPIRAPDGQVAAGLLVIQDVSEQRRMEADLRTQAAELEAILSAIPAGLIVYDVSGKTTRMNELARQWLGWSEETWQRPMGERVTAHVQFLDLKGARLLPDAFPAVRALHGEVVAGEELRVHLPELPGADFWAMFGARPILGPNGEVTGAVATGVNTTGLHDANKHLALANTQLKAQADQLRQSAELLEQRIHERTAELAAQAERLREQAELLDLTHDAIYVRTLDDTLRFWNRGAAEMYGWSQEEALGQIGHEMLRTVFPDSLAAVQSQMLQTGRWEGELVQACRDGTPITVASRWALWRDHEGRPAGALVINTDISAQKRAQERLAYQASLLENINDAVIAFDENLRITAWNHAAEEQYGWRAEEVLGAYSPDIIGSQASEQERAARLRIMAETGKWQGEITHTRRDGRPMLVELTSMSLRDETGRIFAHVTVNRDISERKQAQEALRRQGERLAILHEIQRAILAERTPGEIAQAAVERLQRATGARRAAIAIFDWESDRLDWLAAAGVAVDLPRQMPLASYWLLDENRQGRTGTIPDIAMLPEDDARRAALLALGIRSYTGVPLVLSGRAIGAIVLVHAEPGSLPAPASELTTQAADSLSVALDNARLRQEVEASREQLRALSRRLVDVQERERRFVADQLYNQAAQVLAAVKLNLATLRQALERDSDAAQRLREIQELLDGSVRELHSLASGLRPASLDRLGLAAALQQYVAEFGQRYGLQTSSTADRMEGPRVPVEIETALYRMAQEALANVAEHSAATHVDVLLDRCEDRLTLIIEDDGRGFDLDGLNRQTALGLAAMRERVESVGGRLAIESTPGHGTTIVVVVPV